MTRLFLSLAVTIMFTQAANASILVDDFSLPDPGAHQSDGTTVSLNSPPNYFGFRQMDGTVNSNLEITTGSLSTVLAGGESAWMEWTVPSNTRSFSDLEYEDFIGTLLNDVSYNVTLNGSSVSGGSQALTSGILKTAQTQVSTGDRLRVTFTAGAGGFGIFTSTAVRANPEPASALLLGSLLFGGLCRFRRRRHVVC